MCELSRVSIHFLFASPISASSSLYWSASHHFDIMATTTQEAKCKDVQINITWDRYVQLRKNGVLSEGELDELAHCGRVSFSPVALQHEYRGWARCTTAAQRDSMLEHEPAQQQGRKMGYESYSKKRPKSDDRNPETYEPAWGIEE